MKWTTRSNPGQWPALGLALTLLSQGCDRPQAEGQGATKRASAPPPARAFGQRYLSQAQPKLQTIKLWLGAEELITELATNQVQIATGMMHRESMAENEGMLFVFPAPYRPAFYMRNTKVPLSAAYIDPDGVIREIHDLQPLDESSVEASSDEIQYVLEVPQGWFGRHDIKAGTLIRTDRGSLRQQFFPGRAP